MLLSQLLLFQKKKKNLPLLLLKHPLRLQLLKLLPIKYKIGLV
jgi:hypothetical protein